MPGNRGLHPRLQVGDRVAVRLFFSGESRQQTPIVISPEIQFWIDHKNEAQKALEAMQWFRSGSITEKTDEELTVISSILATLPVPNPLHCFQCLLSFVLMVNPKLNFWTNHDRRLLSRFATKEQADSYPIANLYTRMQSPVTRHFSAFRSDSPVT